MNVPPSPAATPCLLIQDTPCIGCQYNLRGLAGEGLCPECGTPIEKSLRGNFLRHADPAYVRRLASGTRMLFWATLISLCVNGLMEMLWMFFFLPSLPSFNVIRATNAVGAASVMLCSALSLAGIWRVTMRDPIELSSTRGVGLPQIVLAGAALFPIFRAFQFALTLELASLHLDFRTRWWSMLHVLMLLAYIALNFGLCLWFSHLARRIPDSRLAARTRVVMWGAAAVALPSFVYNLLYCLQRTGILAIPPKILTGIYPALQWETLIGPLVFSISWLILLAGYRRGFLEQAGSL